MKLNEKPFYLSEKDIEWVKETLASMSVEEKIGQLFCFTDMITDEEQLKADLCTAPEMPWKSRMPSVLCRKQAGFPFCYPAIWKAVETAWLIPEPSLADSFRWLQQMKKSRRKDWA